MAGGDIQDYLGHAGPLFETISDKLEVLVDCETHDREKKTSGRGKNIISPRKGKKPIHFLNMHF